ncbi:OPA3-like protein [Fusarium austroafricanum]|uniref:OPA3-like protein n=1 Tax=Fusarium austroafricanum TaxID=2364996 RepID=A0A8H4NIF2_9HYPO|nr:OPA3-like protein [Fusarium austroafricanum]
MSGKFGEISEPGYDPSQDIDLVSCQWFPVDAPAHQILMGRTLVDIENRSPVVTVSPEGFKATSWENCSRELPPFKSNITAICSPPFANDSLSTRTFPSEDCISDSDDRIALNATGGGLGTKTGNVISQFSRAVSGDTNCAGRDGLVRGTLPRNGKTGREGPEGRTGLVGNCKEVLIGRSAVSHPLELQLTTDHSPPPQKPHHDQIFNIYEVAWRKQLSTLEPRIPTPPPAMVPLPLFKLASLFVRHVSKYGANHIKAQAHDHPRLREFAARYGQYMHQLNMRMSVALLRNPDAERRAKEKAEAPTVKTEEQQKRDDQLKQKQATETPKKSIPFQNIWRRKFRPLPENKAVDLFADVIGDAFILSVAIALIVYETWKSSQKPDVNRMRIEELDQKFEELKKREEELEEAEKKQKERYESLEEALRQLKDPKTKQPLLPTLQAS